MENLPYDVLHIIFMNLNITDILNLTLSNKQLYQQIRYNNTLWKSLYHEIIKVHEEINCTDWYQELKSAIILRHKIYTLLNSMSSTCYNFNLWMDLLENNSKNYMNIKFYLLDIINTNALIMSVEYIPSLIYGNKTIRYYALKAYDFIRKQQLIKDWHNLSIIPDYQQIPENMLVILAQWGQPLEYFTFREISTNLDDLTQNVVMLLKTKFKFHPLFDAPQNLVQHWKVNNINQSYWVKNDVVQIDKMIDSVILDIADTVPDANSLEAFYINKVLKHKCGSSFIKVLIKQAIGRRLGINYIVIQLGDDKLNLIYNDNNGLFYNNNHFEISIPTPIPNIVTLGITLVNILVSISVPNNINSLYNNATYENIKELSRICCWRNDVSQINSTLENDNVIDVNCFPKMAKNRLRPEALKYAIGMIMEETKFNYKCVIIGWDIACHHSNKYAGVRPFYTVLLADESTKSVPEENLKPINDFVSGLDNTIEIGKYFSHFYGNHYVPNPEMEELYPEDKLIRMKFYSKTWTYSFHDK